MELPAVGSVVAVEYRRNPTVYSDPALTPRLHYGRVERHEGRWGFVAALGNYDTVPEAVWLEWHDPEQTWEDRDFHQPVEQVRYPISDDEMALFTELEQLPAELPPPDGNVRAPEEMRLRFIAAGFEAGWLVDVTEAVVFYSDDFASTRSTVARWSRQALGSYETAPDRVHFEWPVEGREPGEWGLEFTRDSDGWFYAKSDAFGDEFKARFEQRAGYHLLTGLWAGDGFLSFFGVVLPDKP